MPEENIDDYGVGSLARLGLSVLAHKWTLVIVLALKSGPLRFTELRRRLPAVTAQVLSESLRQLERDGLIVRDQQDERPPRVLYRLTELGGSLCGPAKAIRAWTEEYGSAVVEARQKYDARAGDEAHHGLSISHVADRPQA